MAANISSLWTDKRSTLSRSIPRWFVRVVGRGKRDFPPRFDWKKTFDSKRGFLFSSRPPLPLSREQCRFPWRAVDPTSISRWRLRPRFISSALPWLNSKGGREREKKKKNSVIVQISRRNRKLWRKFFERRSKARSVSVLCPWNIVRPAIKRSSDRWML